jgi:hypothetical protein
MAHVHGEKAATQIKSVVDAGTARMMDSSMGKMGMGSMIHEGMSSMMKGGMGSMMHENMGSMIKTPVVATGAAAGTVISASASAGKSVITKIFTHPLVIFGLGVTAGYYLYKYRKSIISASDEAQQEE